MVAASLMEAMAAVGVQALVLASVLVTSTALTLLAGETWGLEAQLFAERQVEHLLDTAAARAGSGPSGPPAIANASASKVVFFADLDGNGSVDTSSSEKTEIEVRSPTASTRSLFHRLGNQGMTVEDRLPATATIAYVGPGGLAASAADATGILLPRRRVALSVAIPARLP
jgi:hypothetical protein